MPLTRWYTAVNQRDQGLSVNIRGIQDYGRVNMSIDGMRQNYQQSGHQQRNGTLYVDPEMVSSVEIDKGAQSGMAGAAIDHNNRGKGALIGAAVAGLGAAGYG